MKEDAGPRFHGADKRSRGDTGGGCAVGPACVVHVRGPRRRRRLGGPAGVLILGERASSGPAGNATLSRRSGRQNRWWKSLWDLHKGGERSSRGASTSVGRTAPLSALLLRGWQDRPS